MTKMEEFTEQPEVRCFVAEFLEGNLAKHRGKKIIGRKDTELAYLIMIELWDAGFMTWMDVDNS